MPDYEAWKFINTFAPWVSALGTVAAVVTSLWLAGRDRLIHLSVRAALCRQMGARFTTVTVTNVGRRTATVGAIGWRIGWFRRLDLLGLKRQEFIWPHYEGTELPAKLLDGDYAQFNHPLDVFADAILNTLDRRSLRPWPYLRFGTMQAIVSTTAGRTFYATITKDLRKELASRVRVRDEKQAVS